MHTLPRRSPRPACRAELRTSGPLGHPAPAQEQHGDHNCDHGRWQPDDHRKDDKFPESDAEHGDVSHLGRQSGAGRTEKQPSRRIGLVGKAHGLANAPGRINGPWTPEGCSGPLKSSGEVFRQLTQIDAVAVKSSVPNRPEHVHAQTHSNQAGHDDSGQQPILKVSRRRMVLKHGGEGRNSRAWVSRLDARSMVGTMGSTSRGLIILALSV